MIVRHPGLMHEEMELIDGKIWHQATEVNVANTP